MPKTKPAVTTTNPNPKPKPPHPDDQGLNTLLNQALGATTSVLSPALDEVSLEDVTAALLLPAIYTSKPGAPAVDLVNEAYDIARLMEVRRRAGGSLAEYNGKIMRDYGYAEEPLARCSFVLRHPPSTNSQQAKLPAKTVRK